MDYALVLGGGGAKGSYELGVYKALVEMNINVTSIYGTSIGALNGAMFVQGSIDRAEKLWNEIKASDVMNIESKIEELLLKGGVSSTLEFMMHVISSGGIDITPLKNLLEEIIDEDKIRNSLIDYGIVTFSLDNFKPQKLHKSEIENGRLIDYLIASSALPAFKKHTINNERFIDGAFCDNVPLSFAVSDNIENIIVVDILSPGFVERANVRGRNVIYIKNPHELKGSVLSFNMDNIKFNMNLGYLDCLKAFGKLHGHRYYINNTEKLHINIEESDIVNIYKFFGVEINHRDIRSSNIILDKIMRLIKSYTGDDITKDKIFISALEIAADILSIEKVQVYSLRELINKVYEALDYNLNNFSDDGYLDYLKNSVLLTDRKKVLSSLLEQINKEANLIYYLKSCVDGEAPQIFRKLMATVYPKTAIAAAFLMYIDSMRGRLN
ncbi:MAG: patatin-like phospholipase family protein [Clostridium sp.]